MKNIDCPVCGAVASPFGTAGSFEKLEQNQNCPICGPFTVSHAFKRHGASQIGRIDMGLLHGVLYRFARENSGHVFPVVLDPSNYREVIAGHGVPRDHLERLDSLLRLVAEDAPGYGQWTEAKTIVWWRARLYTLDADQARDLLDEHVDLLRMSELTPGMIMLRITRAGWARVRELRETRSEARDLFVASWAHSQVRGVVDKAATQAAESCGLRPRVGNELAEDRKIDDSILATIRRARVVVADFTGSRGGVYFEAGFAAGLGIPVIYTCQREWGTLVPEVPSHDMHEDPAPKLVRRLWRDERHFDVEHYPFLFWSGEADLGRDIANRIAAWGLAVPKNP
jgi:hypothetical protein